MRRFTKVLDKTTTLAGISNALAQHAASQEAMFFPIQFSCYKMTKKRKDTAQCHKGIVLSLLSDSYPFHLKDTFFFSITPFTLSSSSQPSFCNIISFDNSIKQHYLCFSVSVPFIIECWRPIIAVLCPVRFVFAI